MFPASTTRRSTRCCVAAIAIALSAWTIAAQEAPPQRPEGDLPSVLNGRSLNRGQPDFVPLPGIEAEDVYMPPLLWPIDPPPGYTGPSGVAPREGQTNSHFVPMEDRWRVGFPQWDRYDRGHPLLDEYPYVQG